MARTEGKSMVALLDEAVEVLRRQRFLEQVNAAYARLRDDPDAWGEVEAERRDWEATVGDGLIAAEGRAPYGRRAKTRRKRKRP